MVINWYHRQFQRVARARYCLKNPKEPNNEAETAIARMSLAEYFMGKWYLGKPYKGVNCNRTITNQELRLGNGREYNRRKLAELPYQLTKLTTPQSLSTLWPVIEQELCDLQFIEAKCHTGFAHDVVSFFLKLEKRSQPQVGSQSEVNSVYKNSAKITEYLRFMRNQVHLLSNFPDIVVQAAAMQPNGSSLANAASRLTSKRNWIEWLNKPITTDPCIFTLNHSHSVTACVYSPKSDRILSASLDRTVKIWNSSTGALLFNLYHDQREEVTCCNFSPDGHIVISGTSNGSAKLWDADSGHLLCTLDGHPGDVKAVAYSPNKEQFVVASKKYLIVWNPETNNKITQLTGHLSQVLCCCYSPDSSLLASGATDTTVRIWETKTGLPIQKLEGHSSPVTCCVFSPVSNQNTALYLASSSEDGTCRVWEPRLGRIRLMLKQRLLTNKFFSCSYSKSNYLAVAAREDILVFDCNRIPVFTGDPEIRYPVATLRGHSSTIMSVAYSSKYMNQLISGAQDWTLKVWDLQLLDQSTNKDQTLVAHKQPVTSVSFSSDGCFVATASKDKELKVWEVSQRKLLHTFIGHTTWINSCRFSNDGSLIVAVSDVCIKVWNISTKELVISINRDGVHPFMDCAISENNASIIAVAEDSPLILFNIADGSEIQIEAYRSRCYYITAASISTDLSRVGVSDSEKKELLVFDTKTHAVLDRISNVSSTISALCFSRPDPTRLVCGGQNGTVQVWGLASATSLFPFPIARIIAHSKMVNCLAYYPAQDHLVSFANEMKIWSTENPNKP
eukprot:TRINITY_DN3238_c0_g1_i1.p1 TRINITY_DN3238_c0_g1~~TRINITY_DN3238_c0_g1_i1.p1  ORF type:complete len:790 (+),score=108.86 TRINITY_DN3238_c0_g1_i1:913-3282(+)